MKISEESLEHLKRIGGDGFVAKIITVFLESAPTRIVELRTGTQSGDLDMARRAAHSLKSSVSNFGARQTIDLAHAVETLALEGRSLEMQTKAAELEAALEQLMDHMRVVLREEQADNEEDRGN